MELAHDQVLLKQKIGNGGCNYILLGVSCLRDYLRYCKQSTPNPRSLFVHRMLGGWTDRVSWLHLRGLD